MNNHAGPTLTRPSGTTFSHINAQLSQGKGCLGYPRPYKSTSFPGLFGKALGTRLHINGVVDAGCYYGKVLKTYFTFFSHSSYFYHSVERHSHKLWFCITLLYDWLKSLAPFSHPIRSKLNQNQWRLARTLFRARCASCTIFGLES